MTICLTPYLICHSVSMDSVINSPCYRIDNKYIAYDFCTEIVHQADSRTE